MLRLILFLSIFIPATAAESPNDFLKKIIRARNLGMALPRSSDFEEFNSMLNSSVPTGMEVKKYYLLKAYIGIFGKGLCGNKIYGYSTLARLARGGDLTANQEFGRQLLFNGAENESALGIKLLEEAGREDSSSLLDLGYYYFLKGEYGLVKDISEKLTSENISGGYWLRGLLDRKNNQLNKAMENLTISGDMGFPLAYVDLGSIKAEINDEKSAFKFYDKAAEAGVVAGKFNLGLSYFRGDGVEIDKKKSIEILSNSDILDSSFGLQSAIILSEIFYSEDDKSELGKYWRMKAAEMGDQQTLNSIKKIISDNVDPYQRAVLTFMK